MNIEPNVTAIRHHMESCAHLFGGSAFCGSGRNYESGWGYAVVAYDDSEAAFIEITVSPGEGDQPQGPVSVAAELLSLPEDIVEGLGRLEGRWGSPHATLHGAVVYVAFAPLHVDAGRKLRALIRKQAASVTS